MTTDIEQKFSLLNDLDNADEDTISVYYFQDVGKMMINDVYMLIPIDAELRVMIENLYMNIKVIKAQKILFVFEIECRQLHNFHLFIRGES